MLLFSGLLSVSIQGRDDRGTLWYWLKGSNLYTNIGLVISFYLGDPWYVIEQLNIAQASIQGIEDNSMT